MESFNGERGLCRKTEHIYEFLIKQYLHPVVAVFRVQDEAGQVSGQLQAAEIPHQVPENNGMLAEELVCVDHLTEAFQNKRLKDLNYFLESRLGRSVHLVALVFQKRLQLLAEDQGTEVRHRYRFGVWSLCSNAILLNQKVPPITFRVFQDE